MLFSFTVIFLVATVILLAPISNHHLSWWVWPRKKIDNLADRFIALLCGGPRLSPARELSEVLWQLGGEQSRRLKASEIPGLLDYKHFTELGRELLRARHDFGASLKRPLRRLRIQLDEDFHFEQRLRSEMMTHYIQYALSICVIWGFTFSLATSLESMPRKWVLLLMFFTQVCGVLLMSVVLRVLRWRQFCELESFHKLLEGLMCLQPVGLSIGDLLGQVEIEQLEGESSGAGGLAPVKKRLLQALKAWREQGRELGETLEELSKDLDFYRQKALRVLHRQALGLSFFSMAFFVLPSFFMGLSGPFRAFLIE